MGVVITVKVKQLENIDITYKYIALQTDYEETINWYCGIRHGNADDWYKPNLYNYVSIWTPSNGSRHTILGNDILAMQKQCYNEFIEGKRNNIEPYPLVRVQKNIFETDIESKDVSWFGKIFK